MIKYAKIIDPKTGLCEVGLGTNASFYQSIGMTQLDVQQSDVDGSWYLADKCPMKTDEQKELEEKERVAKLYLTGADVERGIYQARGMDFEDIVECVSRCQNGEALSFDVGTTQATCDAVTLELCRDIDIKALKIELKANNFYRGNPYVSAIGTLLGFSEKQLDKFFEDGNYVHLLV